jgi:pSer/pThr/pTyr-binding forkhead associated (FHA) protein
VRLEVFQHGQLLQEVSLQDSELWVGRDDSCKIKLDDRAISRKHALFRSTQKGGLEFEKVSEFGWVKLNGQNSSQSKLKAGDRLEFGSYEIRIASDASSVKVAPELEVASADEAPPVIVEPEIQLDAAETAPVQEFSIENAEPALEIPLESAPDFNSEVSPPHNEFEESSGDGATKVFLSPENVKPILNFGNGNQYEIVDTEIAIGRSQQCHVVLEDRRSSRKHSLIIKDDKKYLIKDLGSANGSLVNGDRVDQQELQSGDEIQIGDTKFTFEMVQSDYEVKKQEFISVPPPEMQQVPAELMPSSHSMHTGEEMHNAFGGSNQGAAAPLSPSFEAPKEEKNQSLVRCLIVIVR